MKKREVKNVFDKIARSWDRLRTKPQKQVLDFYKRIGSKKGFFLDVGCGSGRHTKVFEKKFYSIGVDISREMLKRAKMKNEECLFIQADFSFLPFKDDVIDVAICFAVLHHVRKEEQVGALAQLRRVLKLGGESLVSVWKLPQDKKEHLIKWGKTMRYYYAFSKDEFAHILSNFFEDVEVFEDDKNFLAIVKAEPEI